MIKHPTLSFFWPLKLICLEMLTILISIKLVPDDEFPTFLLSVTKSLYTVTTCPYSRHISLLSLLSRLLIYLQFSTGIYTLKGLLHSSVGYGQPKALSQAHQSGFFPIIPYIPHWTGTGSYEELFPSTGQRTLRYYTTKKKLLT